MENLQCNIIHMLETRDFSLLDRLKALCCEFDTNLNNELEEMTTYETDSLNKQTEQEQTISKLQDEIKTIETEIDTARLQPKIIDRKIGNLVKQEEKLQNEIKEAKLRKENVSLEIVDLQDEFEKRKKKKALEWDAIKRACSIYKEQLDFHIKLLENEGEDEYIKVSFFVKDDSRKDKYYAYLCRSGENWEVKQIQPVLSKEHLDALKSTSNITAFLCRMRETFLRHYMKEEQ